MCSSLPEREEAMLASELWRKMVEEEHAQSDARRGAEPPPSDHWAPFAANFAADPHRSDDQLIGPLGRDLEPTDTLMDVGAGGGRHALPLALRCRSVTAVEPSPSMCAVLLQLTSAHGIKNVTIVQSKWEDAEVEPADAVISTHVAYVVRDIAGFVRKMDAHARKMVRIVLYPFSPQSEGFEIWERVHGEKRLALPGLPQLLDVMEELKIPFESEPLSPNHPRDYATPQQALEQTARRLYVQPGDPKMREIELAFEELLIEEDGSYRIKDAPVLVPHMVSWSPATAR